MYPRNGLRGDQSASSIQQQRTSSKKTSGELRVLPAEKHRCDPVSACTCIQVTGRGSRDQGKQFSRSLEAPQHGCLWNHKKALNHSDTV